MCKWKIRRIAGVASLPGESGEPGIARAGGGADYVAAETAVTTAKIAHRAAAT